MTIQFEIQDCFVGILLLKTTLWIKTSQMCIITTYIRLSIKLFVNSRSDSNKRLLTALPETEWLVRDGICAYVYCYAICNHMVESTNAIDKMLQYRIKQ